MLNFSAIYSIIAFRIKEFLQEYHYSLLAPLTTNFLFILVFITVENYYTLSMDSGSFVEFIAPGLIIMIVAQESYDNSSATLIHMKQIGSLDDWLMAPIYRIEILISLIFTSLIIGIILALFNFFIFTFLIDIEIYNFFYFFYYLFLVIIFFSCLGCFVGIIFNSWDSQSTFSSFFVAPINFLSGTFFSILSVINKSAAAFSGGFVLLILYALDFDPLGGNSEEVLLWLTCLYAIAPITLKVLPLLLMLRYNETKAHKPTS